VVQASLPLNLPLSSTASKNKMFLSKLYKYNKALFIAFLLFIVSFVYINFKWGVVAAPVFQYGMFSGVHRSQDPQTIYTVIADGKNVDLTTLSFEQRDLLVQQLALYNKHREINASVANVMQFTAQLISGDRWENIYQPVFNDTIFSAWYKQKLHRATSLPCTTVEVFRQTFQYTHKDFRPISYKEKLMFIVP
jgi:hypothetical protein